MGWYNFTDQANQEQYWHDIRALHDLDTRESRGVYAGRYACKHPRQERLCKC